MTAKKTYDRTVAEIAATIAAGLLADMQTYAPRHDLLARDAVALARAIVAETERTEADAPEAPGT